MSAAQPAADQHVCVSGGSRGLGKALVQGILDAGYRVSTFSRRGTPFTDSLAGNPNAHFEELDIADTHRIRAFLAEAEKQLGPPLGLVNCAGIAVEGVLATMGDADLQRVISVNLVGTLSLTREVVRRMLVGGRGGSIVNVSSIIGLRGYSGLAAYGATKGGIDAMTRALARELGDRRIRVTSLAPGYLETDMTDGLSGEQRQQIVRRTPLGRLGVSEDVVGALLFLLSDASAFMTGQVLVVDGGITT